MKKLKECYFNLIMIASAIRYCYASRVAVESFINMSEPIELDLSRFPDPDIKKSFAVQALGVHAFIIIQTCAFLDEYKLFHKIMPDDPAFKDESIRFKKEVKAILKPAIGYITQAWKDLYKVRNEVLAHGWRTGGGDAIQFTDIVNHPANIPVIAEEFTLLVGILGSIIEVLQEYNPIYFAELDHFMKERDKNKPYHYTVSNSHAFSTEQYRAVKALMQLEVQAIQKQK